MATTTPHQALLNGIAVSQTDDATLDLLKLLDATRTPMSGTALVTTHDVGRATVYNRLDDLTEAGLVKRIDAGFWTTRTGHLALRTYRGTSTELRDETIAFLAGSAHRVALLRTLALTPSTKAELAASESLPSRSTIQRTVRQFEQRGWLRKTATGEYTISEAGESTLDRYQQLAAAFEQLTQKSAWLNRLAYWADPPLAVLSGSDLVTNTEEDPHAMMSAAVDAADLRDGGLDHVRSVTPVFDPTLYDIFGQHVDSDTTFEVLYDKLAYQQLTNPRNLHYLAGAIAAPTVDVRIHPDPLYTGLGIYNRETVMLGGSTRESQDYAIVGDGDTFREWANATFDALWAESVAPGDRFTRWIKQTVPAPLSSA
jgi:predicted transcriptional regulator